MNSSNMLLPDPNILLSGLAKELESMPKAHLGTILQMKRIYVVYQCLPGDHVQSHLLEDVLDVDQGVHLGHHL